MSMLQAGLMHPEHVAASAVLVAWFGPAQHMHVFGHRRSLAGCGNAYVTQAMANAARGQRAAVAAVAAAAAR